MASRLLGLVREQTFAMMFGAGRELDAFVTAFRIPNLLRDLFAEGALSAAFVTTFTRHFDRHGAVPAWRLANVVLTTLVLVVTPLCLLGILFAPSITSAIAPGFHEIPGKYELTVKLARIMTPFLLLVALAALAMGILNSRNRFGIPALASAFFNLGSVLGGVLCAWWMAPEYVGGIWGYLSGGPMPPAAGIERAITGMALGTLMGGGLQLLVQIPSLYRAGFRYRPLLAFRDPGLRRVLRLMGPATVGAAAVQVNVFVNSNFASYLGDGPVSWLNVAFRFMQLPIGLFGVAVGTVALPALARHVAANDRPALSATLGHALTLTAALSVPAALGLALFGTPIIGLIYEHGRFGPADTSAAAAALAGYAIGLVGYAGIKVVTPAFYALDDVRTPMRVSLLSIAVNLGLNWMFVHQLGLAHVGLAVATSCVAIGNFAILAYVLQRRIGSLGTGLVGMAGRIVIATAIMAVAALAADALVCRLVGSSHLVRLAAILPSALGVFAVACRVLAVPLPRLRR